ncbi:hypothetical protein DM558_09750 [Entomomonas moraniae]|uniref:Uncharacterized protein n=1 Tax=Entomomonas moraniae TaxID=2213226 RepID=A0A3Q9JLQ0_9GAMM|nr:ATP-binding protein [Entomomonas moraniae]AZS51040.1 hypothetical protein DM558_09750 [Entomomonas moraniae]
MALEAGGYAEKFGNRYEANWVAYQLLRLLEEKINWITIEPIGDDEVGVDIIIGTAQDQTEHHQCKVGVGTNEHWTLSQLNESKIFYNALFQIERGATEFHLISPLPSKKMSDLSDSALNSNMIPDDFMEYQVKASQEREKDFTAICNYLGLNINVQSDIKRAIYFLQKFKVTPYIINRYTQSELEDKASALFLDNPIKLLSFLKNYPVEFNKLRKKITLSELLVDLKNSDFEQKIVPDDTRISPVLDTLSTEFEESIKPYLICNTLIPRNELSSIIDSIQDNAVTLIKAEAGTGKSALLLELHNHLKANNIISVPIRLDRRRPEHNADKFGKSLGFPYSPVHSLVKFASQQKIVFILDQLDAIRWTASHSNNALDICREIVKQIISLRKQGKDISIVLASRDFDLNEDIALSSWLQCINDNRLDIKLTLLDENTIIPLVSPYEAYSSLAEEKKEILKIPLWLGIYLSIAKRTQTAPQFNNKLELVRKFWEDRLKQISLCGVTEQEATVFIDDIVTLMINQSQLSISENALSTGTKKQLEALISVGLLSKQNQRISFRHQALFDYQVGTKLFKAGSESPESLLFEIGPYETQTLAKREHLKYALNLLLDSGQDLFCNCVEAILFNDNIRFHLKYLVLNSIKEIKGIKKPAKSLIDKIIASPALCKKFLTISCGSNIAIIHYLSENQHISNWLHSSDDSLINIAINLLSSIAANEPELITKELSTFVGQSKQWNQRVYSALPWKIEDDTDDIFELRKRLLNLGCTGNYINWKSLSKTHPLRALSLIELILEHYRNVICESPYSTSKKNVNQITHRDGWTDDELKEIKQLAKAIPTETIELLFKYIDSIFNSEQDECSTHEWFYRYRHSNYHDVSSIRHGLFTLIETAGQQLEAYPDILLSIIAPYMEKSNAVITHLVATLLLNLSNQHADLVINWLLAAPETRLACGNEYIEPAWILSGKLITKFSPHCSDALFLQLEKAIYFFPPSKEVEQIKRRLKVRRNNVYCSYWGELQYFLLPTLDQHRISCKSKNLIPVLERKFSSYSNSDFCQADNSIGGIVTSPLPEGNKLSNKAWRKLILTPASAFSSHKLTQVSDDAVSKADIEQFARDLQSSVINEPIRFAQLALSLPQTIHTEYIDAFFYGLAETDNTRASDNYKEQWEACPAVLIEQVILHFNNEACEYSLARLLASRADSWSKQIIDILINLAKYSTNPESNQLTVWSHKKGKSTDCADAESLLSTTINSIRGIAYRGISDIFWSNETFALENLELVDCAINDEHPSVKIAAIFLLTPLLNYQNDYAHEKFIELCHKDPRMTRGFNAYRFFNQGFEKKHQQQYVDLVLSMLTSTYDEIKKQAAKQIYARWFFNGLFEEQLNTVLQGDNILKEGCASVISQFLQEDKYHDKIYKIEYAYQLLINDDNDEILRKVGICVGHENYWLKPNADKLFSLFVTSKAAVYCLFQLFDSLEKYPRSLSNLSDPILQLVENITGNYNANNQPLRIDVQESSLLAVLQRLYDEATEDMDKEAINTCLDIWDKLLQSDMYSAINAINKLDDSLLS